ncbi:hypothetical protein CVM39_10790 [Pseudooceanicola antarcticus]|uniref:Uncharacterized protein n=1 Tax=Pseudooceanicola antarcticus TaxID=1247613 RepID=A0ABX4MNN8_9RHOB|nr:hypothetical protein CVM39_10790 [Pseudooceanicola antarcticus]
MARPMSPRTTAATHSGSLAFPAPSDPWPAGPERSGSGRDPVPGRALGKVRPEIATRDVDCPRRWRARSDRVMATDPVAQAPVRGEILGPAL